jgi:hypothetical protein
MTRLFLAVLAAVCVIAAAPAHADVGGQVPAPGSCDYPAVGTFGAAFGEYDYACQFPVEINGARHTTLFGGGMWQVTATAGVAIMAFNASISATVPTGVLRGITYWACPDFSMSAAPNPPGAWKNELSPAPCKTVAPRPQLIPDDQPEPPFGAPPAPPVPEPIAAPAPAPAPGWQPGLSPAITNPDQPNPEAVPGPDVHR